MRMLLTACVLATAAVAWAAAVHAVDSPRAVVRAAPREAVPECPPAPNDTRRAGDRIGEAAEEPEARAEQAAAEIAVLVPAAATADAVAVDVVLVDGQSGDVMAAMTTSVECAPEPTVEYRVGAPAGYVAESAGARQLKARVSRRAERLRVVEPLRREADICVRVVDTEGRRVSGARVVEAFLGGGPPGIIALNAPPPEPEPEPEIPEEQEVDIGATVPQARSSPSSADGWLRVRGVPHLLEERYWIVVGKGKSEAFVDVLLGAFGERVSAEARLPVASWRPQSSSSAIGIGGGCGGYRSGRYRRLSPATLEVLVRLRDGRMGAGLGVVVGGWTGVTDGCGRVRFEGLRPGSYAVRVDDPDFLWSEARLELGEGERRAFVLSEGPGWTARALLLDSTGRPVPFARVEILSKAPVPYLRVEDGVQDLVFLTDAKGEIEIPDLHHAPVDLTFRYGSRSASVTLRESDPCAAVRLPPP